MKKPTQDIVKNLEWPVRFKSIMGHNYNDIFCNWQQSKNAKILRDLCCSQSFSCLNNTNYIRQNVSIDLLVYLQLIMFKFLNFESLPNKFSRYLHFALLKRNRPSKSLKHIERFISNYYVRVCAIFLVYLA